MIPTVSQWGIVALGLLLLFAGIVILRRRVRTSVDVALGSLVECTPVGMIRVGYTHLRSQITEAR